MSYDENGINLAVMKDIKEVQRGRIKEYAEAVAIVQYSMQKEARPWNTTMRYCITMCYTK